MGKKITLQDWDIMNRKTQSGHNYNYLNIALCIGKTFNMIEYGEVKKLIKIFSLQNSYKNDGEFFETMKKHADYIFSYYWKNGTITTEMENEIKETFKEALKELKDNSLFEIGKTNIELIEWYLENFGTDELKTAYNKLGKFIDYEKYAKDIYNSNYDIGKFDNCYYSCPGIGVYNDKAKF